MPDPRLEGHIRRISELAVGDMQMDAVPFMRMLMDVRDEAAAIADALRADRTEPATLVRYAAEVLRLYTDDAVRALGPALRADESAKAKANDAAGKVVNYGQALRDIYRRNYP